LCELWSLGGLFGRNVVPGRVYEGDVGPGTHPFLSPCYLLYKVKDDHVLDDHV